MHLMSVREWQNFVLYEEIKSLIIWMQEKVKYTLLEKAPYNTIALLTLGTNEDSSFLDSKYNVYLKWNVPIKLWYIFKENGESLTFESNV